MTPGELCLTHVGSVQFRVPMSEGNFSTLVVLKPSVFDVHVYNAAIALDVACWKCSLDSDSHRWRHWWRGWCPCRQALCCPRW